MKKQIQIENIHIIFNEFSRETLINNKELNIKTNTIICLEYDLRIGPISNLNFNKNIKVRKEWFSNILYNTIHAEKIILNVENDIEKIASILGTDNHKIFYLWTGKNALDIISTARLITILIKQNVTIFIADFNGVTLYSQKGNSFSPKSLVEVNSSQIHKLFNHFKEVKIAESIEWIDLWNKIELDNALLRTLDSNGDINSVKETYFDNLLQSFCDNEFKKARRIIGETLVKSKFSVSDWFLNWRLIRMSEMNKLETIGEQKLMSDYQVKIPKQKKMFLIE